LLIALGVILLVGGFLLGGSLLYSIGFIVLIIGLVLIAKGTRLMWPLIAAIVVTVAVITAAITISYRQHRNSNGSQTTLPTSTQPRQPTYGTQVTLPFTGLDDPVDVAVDAVGNLYVGEHVNGARGVLKLPAGSASQQVLPVSFGESYGVASYPGGVAVDARGNLYATSVRTGQVLKLPAGSSSQEVLPFTGLDQPQGVAVDAAGNIYVADHNNQRVLKLPAGSSSQEVLPFSGLEPDDVAVDAAGNLYVTDFLNGRVLKLPTGSSSQEVLPFTGLRLPSGVAVDAAGNIYVCAGSGASNQVLRLPAGSSSQQVLPLTGLNITLGVAVDAAGNVYVTDSGNNRVVKLPAG
jgi:serine/threonine-protein kinase